MTNSAGASILEEYENKKDLYESFAKKVQEILAKLLADKNIHYLSPVAYRIKKKESLKKKLAGDTGAKYTKLEDVTDIAGLRVITYFEDYVDQVAKIIEKQFSIAACEDKRNTFDPSRFGYASLHYVVCLNDSRRKFQGLKAEIQIRSVLQHAWAEIEHDLAYKAEDVPAESTRMFASLSGAFWLADQQFIRLRKELGEHEKNVEEKIDTNPELLSIDKASLTAFIQRSQLVQTLDQCIASSLGGTLYKDHLYQDPTHITQLVDQLRWLRIQNIQDLKESLAAHETQIVPFAKKLLAKRLQGREERFFGIGISIVYLAYIIAAKTLKQEQLENFVVDTRVVSYVERDSMREDILHAYNSVKKV